MIRLSPDEISFPDPRAYNPDEGIIALGGDLSTERVLFAYECGLFPWYNPTEEILWWCPDPRCVLFPQDLKISKSMRKVFRDGVFTFTENQCFYEVMENCQKIKRKDEDGTWISSDFLKTYHDLHLMGIAKSVEVWQNGALVGGFYGLIINKIFCGESMFAHVSNASKAGFIYFVEKYKDVFSLIDCQVKTNHLVSLGATEISKIEYLDNLDRK
ncbi:leucyl/phenylalanyl-tRNA--protein transferase [Frigoriflavimonas asaccharolytica]|uniref:Leucyl/phenylalanyl-tRNA--protein transferase n=1 Tax=Frigoriflavimonas asaccharolytica TaxID=2735899 RepID=A0A8J8GAD9_9FLAO|nr:leucyl/phenylalanyl-tRNA--protein transferase [Frigoriflavimonas asaccharolytica]NRS93968.1 leucyl/phenylalanyl-tRNA--protein transferase [Frigoriflavimonas asaccharolytica]